MSNKARIWLYKEGNECSTITGGWTSSSTTNTSSPYLTKNSDHVYFSCGATRPLYNAGYSYLNASKVINLSYFNKMGFRVTTQNSNQHRAHSAGFDTSTTDSNDCRITNAWNTSNVTNQIYEKDIDYGSTGCPFVYTQCNDGGPYKMLLYEYYLDSKDDIISIYNKDNSLLQFSLNNLGGVITFTQVDILINGEIIQSYKDNINDSISYNFGNNKNFTIQATYTQGDGIVETAELEIDFRYENGIDKNTVLYLRGDSFNDLSLNPKEVTNISSSIENNSIIRNGAIRVKDIELDDFTIELEFKRNGLSTNLDSLFDTRKDTSVGNGLYCGFANAGEGLYIYCQPSNLIATNQHYDDGNWHHMAVVKKGNTLSLFVDGQSIGTVDSSFTTQLHNFHIGCNFEGSFNFNGNFKNIRVSNIARYTENFELPTQPFTSVNITDIEFDNNNISCQVYKGSDNESISKVDVLLNGNVINSLTENYNIINQTINEKEIVYGDNEIEVRAYYYDNYYVSKKYSHYKDIPLDTFEPLPNLLISSNLCTIKNRISEINAINKIINSNLKLILESKGFDCGNTPRLSKMVEMVKELDNDNSAEITDYINRTTALQLEVSTNRSSLATVLTDKGIDVTEEDDMASLISKVDEELKNKNENLKNTNKLSVTQGINVNLYSWTNNNPNSNWFSSTTWTDVATNISQVNGPVIVSTQAQTQYMDDISTVGYIRVKVVKTDGTEIYGSEKYINSINTVTVNETVDLNVGDTVIIQARMSGYAIILRTISIDTKIYNG